MSDYKPGQIIEWRCGFEGGPITRRVYHTDETVFYEEVIYLGMQEGNKDSMK